jgi:hypothetical protein
MCDWVALCVPKLHSGSALRESSFFLYVSWRHGELEILMDNAVVCSDDLVWKTLPWHVGLSTYHRLCTKA